ncbi:response regulator [Thermodesulfobacteriota bacterium]
MVDNNKVTYFFPLHLKLLGVILLFLVILTIFFSVGTYLSRKSHLNSELKAKRGILEALIVKQYESKSQAEFLEYIKTEPFIHAKEAIHLISFLIIDANDSIVYSSYTDDTTKNIIKKVTEENKKRYLIEKGEYSYFTTTLAPDTQTYDYQICLKKDHAYNGIVYISVSLERFQGEMAKVLLAILIISFIVFFLSTVIFLYSTKAITKPIRLLKNAAENVANGKLDILVDFTSDDEIGLLANSFNIMTDKLKEFNEIQIDQIKNLNNELIMKNVELESSYEEIEAANEELETTNEELISTNEELEIANKDLFTMAQDLKESKVELEKNMMIVNEANEELRMLNRMKTSFLGMASHELKTPLVMIKGYAELILDSRDIKLEDSTAEMVSHILKGADTLNNIIKDMLDITKIEAKELKLHIVPVELKLIIETVALEMLEVARKRKITISIDEAPKHSALVDAPQIHRVLVHLVSNAIKFTPDNGKIKISANKVKDPILDSMYKNQEPNEYIDISIADSGIGIEKSEHDRIFDVFYEIGDIDHHRTSKIAYLGKGSGLGLTICKGIVEAHCGRIWVESEEVNLKTFPGTTFHVLLPFKRLLTAEKVVAVEEPKEKEPIKIEPPKKPETEIPIPKKRPKILLVEDDNDIVELTTLILEDKYNIEVTSNGADGIKKAFEFKPHLILLDIYMKGLNGFEVCRILKENDKTKNIPIAMFTAGTQKYEMEKGFKAGVNDYITKPFNPSELVERIEKLIAAGQAKNESDKS